MKSTALTLILVSAYIHHECEAYWDVKQPVWEDRQQDLAGYLQYQLLPNIFNQLEKKHDGGGDGHVHHVTGSAADKKQMEVQAAPKYATCKVPLNVRQFHDECTSTCLWCPTTKLKKCSTSPRPNCIPWCDPFLKEASTAGIAQEIVAQPKYATCSTPLNVRNFEDECTSTCLWCPCTKLKKCSTSPRPNCIPWCDPFLKDRSVTEEKELFYKAKSKYPAELRKYLGRLYKEPQTEDPLLRKPLVPSGRGLYLAQTISDKLMAEAKLKSGGSAMNVRNINDDSTSTSLGHHEQIQEVHAAPKYATCKVPLNVRQFHDECTSTCLWCPTTKLKKCSTSPRPNCIPWCDPFLKDIRKQDTVAAKPKAHTCKSHVIATTISHRGPPHS